MDPATQGRSCTARVIVESAWSDGTTAADILGFWVNEAGSLEADFKVMPLIPDAWRGAAQPSPFQDPVRGMVAWLRDGEVPELLFLTPDGVFVYAPGTRQAGGTHPGLLEVLYYPQDNATASVVPQSEPRFPPQIEVVGNRVYWTFCDGGGAWVYDGVRIRPFGYPHRPGPPCVEGPARKSTNSPNAGGFSVAGRVGTVETDWQTTAGLVVGGLDVGHWEYGVLWENEDGAYSASSLGAPIATQRLQLADPTAGTYVEELRRRHRVFSIPVGPVGTRARILTRTRNLDRLPTGDDGRRRYLHRIPNNIADEYVDDIPDGELGPEWLDRDVAPLGFYLFGFFGGSMFAMRTDAHASRVWWSEQENLNGATPESYLQGHFRDVFPSTGPIVGRIGARLAEDEARPAMLIFKSQAVHYVTGAYPAWEWGTLHPRAGLAGPSLVQACPDGSILWYGQRTFWRFTPDGQVVDIGTPIRKRLTHVNNARVHMGVSWVDIRAGEVVFALPWEDSTAGRRQFIWDWRYQGWREREDLVITAGLAIPNSDLVLLAGVYNNIRTVWCYRRGYAGYNYGTAPTAVFATGWMPLGTPGPQAHSHWLLTDVILTGEERMEGTAQVVTRTDWNGDTDIEPALVHLAHPENDSIAYYNPNAAAPAVYGSSTWRDRRYYSERVATQGAEGSFEVVQVAIATASNISIVTVDLYGRIVAPPGGRTPQTHVES